ncbi:hypothetical protein RMCBS344292_15624 [Rhizopus microsporus]|nr:hypothetical protein RMCBS344292_15624 [Rhizopus microsporus]
MPNLSEYEKKRLENIKANEELLKTLDIPTLGIKRRKIETKTTTSNKKKSPAAKKEPQQPTRVSARLRGKSPEKNVEETRTEREGPKTIESLDEQEHEKLLTLMKRALIPNIEPTIKTEDDVNDKALADQLKELKIKHDWTTVKVTPNRINGCAFHPSNAKLLGCAIDVEGYLGFWDIEGQDEDGEPVVYNYRPHTRTATDIKFDPFDQTKLITSSYDGLVKIFDMNKAEFETLDLGSDHFPITSFDIQQDGQLIWFSTSDGEVACVDKRKGGNPKIYTLREKKIGCIHINPIHQDLLAAGSNDRTTTVWDKRKLKKDPLQSFDHGYAVTSCYWSPNGDILATTSYDDYIRLFELSKDKKELNLKSAIPHNNHTGRARWNYNKYHGLEHQHFVIGNMGQTVDIYSGMNGKELIQLYDEDHITAIPSVIQFHPSTADPTLLTGNASGRMVCWNI